MTWKDAPPITRAFLALTASIFAVRMALARQYLGAAVQITARLHGDTGASAAVLVDDGDAFGLVATIDAPLRLGRRRERADGDGRNGQREQGGETHGYLFATQSVSLPLVP